MLTSDENNQLIVLLKKLTWPVTPEVFDALCESTSVTPIELAVVREGEQGPEVFMILREDAYFSGWHITGSIMTPGRTVTAVLQDILAREVRVSLSDPNIVFIGFRQFMKGNGPNQSRRSQEVSLIHVVHLPAHVKVPLDEKRKFFPLNALPSRIIAHHITLLSDVSRYLARQNI